MNEKSCEKKQFNLLIPLEWIPEIEAYAVKYDLPDVTAAVRWMVRKELDKFGYKLTKKDLVWVMNEIAAAERKRLQKREAAKGVRK